MPLNLVLTSTSSTCWVRFETSDCIALRSEVWKVPEAPWTASSRIRCSMFATSASAPSAVCASEMPSFALRMPWAMPRVCEVMLVAMARPAASSFALLMRLPVDRRSIAEPSILSAETDAFDARSALMLVLITAIVCSRC